MTVSMIFLFFAAICFLLGGLDVSGSSGKPTTPQWQCFGWFFLTIWLIVGALPK